MRDGFEGRCKECTNAERKESRARMATKEKSVVLFKHCGSCDRTLPPEEFHRDKYSGDGLQGKCKECTRITSLKRYNDNIDYMRKQSLDYYYNHLEEHRDYNKGWRENNKDRTTENWNRWYKENREDVLEKASQRAIENRDALTKKQREYRKKKPEIHQISAQKRRAKKKNVRNDLTKQQWQAILKAYQYRCAYCGKKKKNLTMDHITPIALNGEHTISNIVPACRSCNSRKSTKKAPKLVQPLLDLRFL